MVGQVIRSRVFEIESAHNTYAHTAKYYLHILHIQTLAVVLVVILVVVVLAVVSCVVLVLDAQH